MECLHGGGRGRWGGEGNVIGEARIQGKTAGG